MTSFSCWILNWSYLLRWSTWIFNSAQFFALRSSLSWLLTLFIYLINIKNYVVSQSSLVFLFCFWNLFLHSLIFLVVKSQILNLGLEKGNHWILLIETGCKVFGSDWELFSAWISDKAHFLNLEIGIIIKS